MIGGAYAREVVDRMLRDEPIWLALHLVMPDPLDAGGQEVVGNGYMRKVPDFSPSVLVAPTEPGDPWYVEAALATDLPYDVAQDVWGPIIGFTGRDAASAGGLKCAGRVLDTNGAPAVTNIGPGDRITLPAVATKVRFLLGFTS